MSKNNKSVTIKDIAKKFNCSPSTVSRALNNNTSINEHTRRNIQEYAEKMGYLRNSISLRLVNQKSWTVGVIVPSIAHLFFATVVDGIQSVLEPLGYTLIIFQSKEIFELEANCIDKLIANRVDGIFVCVAQETTIYPHFEKVKKKGIPIILIDRVCEFETHTVQVDQYSGAVMAVEHLVKMGCKRIAHLKGPEGLLVSQQRLDGYKFVLNKHNIPIDEDLIITAGLQIWKGLFPTKKLMSLPEPPDGIFAVNDQIALGAIHTIREMGLEIPKDVAVVGFDNEPQTAYTYPTLTTINQPASELGRETGLVFINQTNSKEKNFPIQKIVLPPELIIRNSSLK